MEMSMVKSTKNQRLREKMRVAAKQSKQRTLESPPQVSKNASLKPIESSQRKQIVITEINTITREDELALKVSFKLLPSKNAFSKITADSFFDGQKLSSRNFSVLQGPLAVEDFELTSVLEMKGISAGSHVIRVEMCELCSGEKLRCVSREVVIDYVPLRREDRLIKVPIVRNGASDDFAIVSDSEKDIYREIDESMRNEEASKRDEW
jgi:hypothetical protein